jgi:hypothetical protein
MSSYPAQNGSNVTDAHSRQGDGWGCTRLSRIAALARPVTGGAYSGWRRLLHTRAFRAKLMEAAMTTTTFILLLNAFAQLLAAIAQLLAVLWRRR